MMRKTAILGMIVLIILAVASCSDETTGYREKEPPKVSILNPWDGSTREGIVDVSIDASDNQGIKRVELYVNNKLIGTDTTSPYSISWDMGSIQDGATAYVYIRAVDLSGNVKKSDVIAVTKGDSKTPTATLTGPAEGTESMQGYPITLSGTATDPEDGDLGDANITWSSDIQGPLDKGKNLVYRGLCIGVHRITMTATDSDGNIDRKSRTVTITDNDQKYAYIQNGTYTLGPPLFQSRKVTFTRPLIISKTELSIAEVLDAIKDNKDLTKSIVTDRPKKMYSDLTGYPADLLTATYGNYPACFITIYEVMAICQLLSEKDGLTPAYQFLDKKNVEVTAIKNSAKAIIIPGANGWRLPTEAEWEVAASGGNAGIRYPWGDESPAGRCNCWSDPNPPDMVVFAYERGISPVDSYEMFRNRFGLYNMAGNVAEMCSDIIPAGSFKTYFPEGIDPCGYSEANVVDYIVKGGAWYSNSEDTQIPVRNLWIPFNFDTSQKDAWDSGEGARLVRNLEPEEAPW